MTNWANLLVAAFILAGYAVFMWKVWPIIKDNAIVKRAAEIVYQMEEMYGEQYEYGRLKGREVMATQIICGLFTAAVLVAAAMLEDLQSTQKEI